MNQTTLGAQYVRHFVFMPHHVQFRLTQFKIVQMQTKSKYFVLTL